MITIRKILVPVDFSPTSAAALGTAMGIAERWGASIDVLHVLEYPVYVVPEMTVAVPGAPARSFEAFAVEQAEDEMMRFLEPFDPKAHIALHSQMIRGDATRGILSHAKDGAYDLIVMGTHGRKGLEHVLLGSVAERVIRRAPCPVLTTREGGENPGPKK